MSSPISNFIESHQTLFITCGVLFVVALIASVIVVIFKSTGVLQAKPGSFAMLSAKKKMPVKGYSTVNLPGENVANPLDRYDEFNPEYSTLTDMEKKRISEDLKQKRSQELKRQYPDVITELDKPSIVRPDVESSPAHSSVTVNADTSNMTPSQKTALAMYLRAPTDDPFTLDNRNNTFTPTYAINRDLY